MQKSRSPKERDQQAELGRSSLGSNIFLVLLCSWIHRQLFKRLKVGVNNTSLSFWLRRWVGYVCETFLQAESSSVTGATEQCLQDRPYTSSVGALLLSASDGCSQTVGWVCTEEIRLFHADQHFSCGLILMKSS